MSKRSKSFVEQEEPLLKSKELLNIQGENGLIDFDNENHQKESYVKTTEPEINHSFKVDTIEPKESHSSGFKFAKGAASLASIVGLPIISWVYLPTNAHLIRDGNIGLSWNNGVPEILGPGWHLLLSPLRSFVEQVPINKPVVTHGTFTLVTIREGYLGLARNKGTPILLPPGMHQWYSSTMEFVASFDLSQTVVNIPPFTYVTVNEGTVSITHDNGILKILKPGYHLLKHERHLYHGDLLTTDQFNELNELDLITRDNVPVTVDCTVHFKIFDTRLAALEAGHMTNVRELVMREARAAMASSVLQSTVSDLELLTQSSGDECDESRSGQNYEGRKNHDQDKRAEYLANASFTLQNIGVTLFKIPIRKIKILDKKINERLAQQASIRVKRMEDLDTAEVHKQTIEIEAAARANEEITIAKAQAEKIKLLAEAEFYKAQKINEAGLLLEGTPVAQRLAELDSISHLVANSNTNTIFANSNEGIANALLSNSNFTQKPEKK